MRQKKAQIFAPRVARFMLTTLFINLFAIQHLPILPLLFHVEHSWKKVKIPPCAFLRNMIKYTQLQKKGIFDYE